MDNIKIDLHRTIVTGKVVSNVSINHDAAKKDNKCLDFENILKDNVQKQTGLKFSKHASQRVVDRNISISNEELNKLEEAVQKAGDKGIKDTLVIINKAAFIINVPTKTVVTALDDASMKKNIFTKDNIIRTKV